MSEEGMTVPAFYRKLGGSRHYREFDGSPEAWLWKHLQEERDEQILETAARVIEVYKHVGTYPETGEDFFHVAEFLVDLGWASDFDVEEIEALLAQHRPHIERRVREIHAQRLEDE